MARIEHITSPSNPKIKLINSLFLRKYRKETGLFVAEGLRSVIEALDCRAVPEQLVFSEDADIGHELQRAIDETSARGGLCLKVGAAVLEKLSRKENPQMVMGVFKQRFGNLTAINPGKSTCWVALEEVRDPGNLGTIIRTVDGVGADGVILIGQCCDPFSVESVRASMGSIFSIPVVPCTRSDFLDLTSTWPGAVIATALNERTVDFRAADYKKPLILVMGNEQAGITEALQNAVHQTVKLPMNGRADSLNLAIATGIMLYAAMEPWK
jgi:RNA methyltransferase, TrmH family